MKALLLIFMFLTPLVLPAQDSENSVKDAMIKELNEFKTELEKYRVIKEEISTLKVEKNAALDAMTSAEGKVSETEKNFDTAQMIQKLRPGFSIEKERNDFIEAKERLETRKKEVDLIEQKLRSTKNKESVLYTKIKTIQSRFNQVGRQLANIQFENLKNEFGKKQSVLVKTEVSCGDLNVPKCKDLALETVKRDAAERGSAVLLESVTIIENYQIKKDTIRSSVRAIVSDIKVLERGMIGEGVGYFYSIEASVFGQLPPEAKSLVKAKEIVWDGELYLSSVPIIESTTFAHKEIMEKEPAAVPAAKPLIISSKFFAEEIAQSFKEALGVYQSGDYNRAYDMFNSLVKRVSDVDIINFYQGRSAYRLKLYDEAVSAYERALIANPAHVQSRLELARCYYMLGFPEESEKELKIAYDYSPPQNVKENIDVFLKLVESKKKRHYFSGSISVGVISDDNARTVSDEESYTIPLYNLTVDSAAEKESDTANQQTVALSYLYDFGKKGAWFLQADLIAFAQTYSEVSENDIVYTSFRPAFGYKNGSRTITLAFGTENLQLGGEKYLSTFFIEPKYLWTPNRQFQGSLRFKSQTKEFQIPSDENRSAKASEFGADMKYMMGRHTFYAALTGGKEKKIEGERTDVDLGYAASAFGYVLNLPADFAIGLQYSAKTFLYVDEDPSFLEKRNDTAHTFTSRLSKRFGKSFGASILYTSIKNESNLAPYSYSKGIANFNIVYNF